MLGAVIMKVECFNQDEIGDLIKGYSIGKGLEAAFSSSFIMRFYQECI